MEDEVVGLISALGEVVGWRVGALPVGGILERVLNEEVIGSIWKSIVERIDIEVDFAIEIDMEANSIGNCYYVTVLD
jgi:hypothetical protein